MEIYFDNYEMKDIRKLDIVAQLHKIWNISRLFRYHINNICLFSYT